MTVRALFYEAYRNVGTGTTRTVLLAMLLGSVVVAAIFVDGLTIRQIIAEADRFQRSAASVLTVDAPGRIDGARCEALGRIPGVRASGAVRATDDKLTSVVLPDAPIPVSEVTPHFPRLLTGDLDPGEGVVLSDEAADLLHLGTGASFDAVEGTARIAGHYAYPDDGRRPGFGYRALIVTAANTLFDECWVDAWPQIPNLRSLLFSTVSGDGSADGDGPELAQLNSSLGVSFDGHARFEARITRHLPLLVGIVSCAVGLGALRLRRIQLASSLHCRMCKRDLIAVQLLEAASWIVPAACVGACVALILAAAEGRDFAAVAAAELRFPVTAALGGLAGTVLGAAMSRERDLFRYFKDR
ncbi:hypothetical protein [Leifsonia sp. C5G2]|uniref:hypothetical protein n=1 Tax=Leifsonia sp. C5G2 TaxID=2735269 RepID=UPI0015844955|nr:hypothetical protein [Leifsonia sp. C5G2]NUU05334.1 hypothetical protein [Leifsonia sp. C5G2]